MTETKTRRPQKRTISALLEGVKGLLDHFIWEDFVDLPSPPDNSAEEESPDDFEAYEHHGNEYASEDVEIAVSEFISDLGRKKILKERVHGEPVSLSEVFEAFFGDKHELVAIASSFDKNIEGYFDIIDYDHMSSAYSELLEMVDILKKEIATLNDASNER